MPSPNYWKQSKEFLSNADPKLAKLISNHPEYSISSRGDALESLLRSIIGQQISVQAAASVWGKFEKKIEVIEPKNVLAVSFEELKSCGLSKQKVQYITNICNHFINNRITDHSYWKGRTYKSVYDELITIKGIGPWTAEMFGMFYLLEKDIFPIKDVGIIRAINQLYGNGKLLSIENIIAISDTWRPYRSVACWFLWRSIDSEDVLY